MRDWLPRLVARVPAGVHAKLLAAFLAIVVLLIMVGAVGLQVLGEANRRDEEFVKLQRKIAAYRQLQNDTTAQLYSVASTLLAPDERALDATLRQLNQFGYDLDRLQFVAKDEVDLLARVQQDYDRFTQVVTQVIQLIREGRVAEGQELQLSQAGPLADRLERLTNQLVNKAEADMAARIDQNAEAYLMSRWMVVGFVVGSIGLALLLGFAISWSLVAPVKRMDARLKEIAAGDFSKQIEVPNRDELGTLAANLNRMNDDLALLYQRLDAASRHKSEFLANMSHELRTPLNAIIGFSEVLLERMFGELNDKQEEYLSDILSSGRHLLALINDILDLSKVEAGRMELELGEFSLRNALENGLTMLKERAGRHGMGLSLEMDPDLDVIEADERKVKQVVFNLLSNAVKFTPDGGRVEVAARRADGQVEVTVRDTGVGIAPEDQQRVFEEFRQVGQGTAKTEGTGLGLALTRKFVELHGGRISLESEVGLGSTFTFSLPLRTATAGDRRRAAGDEGAETQGLRDTAGGPTVLLVEDDPRAIELLTLQLEGAGFAVAVARDGEEGLELARRIRPGAITLDITLPKLDGWDFLCLAKSDPALADIPVIIVSMLDERGKGFALGAAEYLVKPVERDQLLSALHRFIRIPGPDGPAKVLAIDDDPMAVELIEAVLAPEGYRVLKASGGEEGVELARRERPALVILDLMMPEVDGFAVVERLRADPATSAIPIVILTSKTMTPAEKARLNGRISHLAQKGAFDRAAFIELVRGFCRAPTA